MIDLGLTLTKFITIPVVVLYMGWLVYGASNKWEGLMMRKAIGITKEAVAKDWAGTNKGFSFVDIQFVMTDDKEFVDIFLDKLDGFVNSCNKAIEQSHYDDEPIRSEVSN